MSVAKVTLPSSVTRASDWDEKYDLLEELCKNTDGVNQESDCFWLVTANPKLNEWLVYNKIELKKARRKTDKVWQERKRKLEALGFHFG